MAQVKSLSSQAPIFPLPHANWVARVLNMLIAVVGRDSLLGQILRQTRSEIASLAQQGAPDASTEKAAAFSSN